jgi:hypothetical protein
MHVLLHCNYDVAYSGRNLFTHFVVPSPYLCPFVSIKLLGGIFQAPLSLFVYSLSRVLRSTLALPVVRSFHLVAVSHIPSYRVSSSLRLTSLIVSTSEVINLPFVRKHPQLHGL